MAKRILATLFAAIALGALLFFSSENEETHRAEGIVLSAEPITTNPRLGNSAEIAEAEESGRSDEKPVGEEKDELGTAYKPPDLPRSGTSHRESRNKAKILRGMFDKDPRKFAEMVEHYMSTQSTDPAWSANARQDLADWFNSAVPQNRTIYTECAEDVCFVDFYMPFEEFVTTYMPRASQFPFDKSGLLPWSCNIPAGNDFFRFYFFRSTFDPAEL